MKKNITITVLIIVIAFLGWILFSGQCNPVEDHKIDARQVAAEKDSVIGREKAEKRRADSLLTVIAFIDSANKALNKKVELNKARYLTANNKVQQLTNEIREYSTDTTFNRKLDSLVAEIENLTYLYNDLLTAYDSLNTLYNNQKMTYEELIISKTQLYTQLRSSYDLVNNKYESLFKDFGQQGKSLKREKLKSRVAAVLALVATGLMIAK